jgi:hypothetical protein
VGKERAEGLDIEGAAAKLVYYVVLLFVLVAFLQQLGLEGVSEPITAFLVQLSTFAPRLIAAGFLGLVAWIAARAVRALVVKVLTASKLDERFSEHGIHPTSEEDEDADDEETDEESDEAPAAPRGASIARTIGESAYWVVFLLFVPVILDTLGLQGLLSPVQSMLDEVLAALPNIASAGLILLVGWVFARILQRVLTNLLSAAGVNRLGERVGLKKALGARSLAELVGVIVYALVLLPVVVGALNALQLEAIAQPASNMLDLILAAIPHLVGAALLVGIAFFVARLVGGLVSNVLAGAGFNRIFVTLGMAKEPATGRWAPAEMAGTLVVVTIMLFASIEAARMLGFGELAEIVSQFTTFGGHVLVGIAIFGIGLLLANVAANAISGSQVAQARILALVARIAILVLAGAMGLRQMGLANEIIQLAFGITLGAIAIAFALALGLGARDVAGREIEKVLTKLREPPRSGDD